MSTEDDAVTSVAEIVDMSIANFKILFECANTIRILADVLSNMLETVVIQVINTADFSGIKIEAMDGKQISLVVSQLRADVTMDCEHTAICLNTKVFYTCVRSAPQHYSVSIESIVGSSSVRIVSFETLSNTSITKFTLPTLVCEHEIVRWKDMEYKTFIDMDTSELKSIVSMCLKLQGETLTFKVRQPIKGTDANDPKRAKKDRRHMMLTISSTGACTQEHTFYSYVEDCGDSCVSGKCDSVAVVPNEDDLETTYEEIFGARHLADFLRSIDRNTVTLKLKKENPLVIHHKFGSQDSYVCLVMAPQISDDPL